MNVKKYTSTLPEKGIIATTEERYQQLSDADKAAMDAAAVKIIEHVKGYGNGNNQMSRTGALSLLLAIGTRMNEVNSGR